MQSARQTAAYQSDLEAARAELRAARTNPALAPAAVACSTETGLVAKSVLVGVGH